MRGTYGATLGRRQAPVRCESDDWPRFSSGQQKGGSQNQEDGEAAGIKPDPAGRVENAAGEEGGDGYRSEDYEIIDALDFSLLLRPVGFGQHGSPADEPEVP